MDTKFLEDNWWLAIIFVAWTLVWKGISLWIAARKNDKTWFVALLVISTAGLLEMFYIFLFSKRDTTQKAVDQQ